MNKIYFAVVLHFHQPIGNFEHILERAYRFSYRPFFSLLARYPDIKMTMHISGCLLDYLEKSHPRTLGLVKEMAARGQIEMMGGGYYEPIFPAIPERDLKGQIEMMSRYLAKEFHFRPRGIWIPERVWEPRLTGILHDAGLRYSVLDDNHLLRAGVNKDEMFGFFLTGEEEKKIAIFSSDRALRYTIPFQLPEEIIGYFKSAAGNRENILFTYGDDGEKFGEWPGTHKWVFEEGWLKKFFELIRANKEWIEMVKLSDYLENNKPLREISIGPASYQEMMQWAGGPWMNFLSKYPEANQMHKKMLYVSDKVGSLDKKKSKGNAEKIKEARKELYEGQCNCAYWHGVFGGLYIYHLRKAVYTHLIEAEKAADSILYPKKKRRLLIKQVDFDGDGKEETVIEDSTFFIYLDPDEGGVIKELDYKPFSLNLTDALSRREESYHKQILDARPAGEEEEKAATIHTDTKAAKPALKEMLIYDKFPRCGLRNYFIKQDLTMDDFFRSSYEELGDFAAGPYSLIRKKKSLVLERESEVGIERVKVSKEIQIKSKRKIEIFYTIEKKTTAEINAAFGIELNIALPEPAKERYHYFYDRAGNKPIGGLNMRGAVSDALSFAIKDSRKEAGFALQFSQKASHIWYFPVETVSQSERAYELNYQGSCIFSQWKPDFKKSKKWHLKASLVIL